MARIRSIKPELWASEQIGRCSPLARLTFIGLISLADDEGRGRGDEGYLWGVLHPYAAPRLKSAFGATLTELSRVVGAVSPLVEFYTVGECRYYWLPGFCKHQYIKKPHASKLPKGGTEAEPVPAGSGIRDQGSRKGSGIKEAEAPEGPPDPSFQESIREAIHPNSGPQEPTPSDDNDIPKGFEDPPPPKLSVPPGKAKLNGASTSQEESIRQCFQAALSAGIAARHDTLRQYVTAWVKRIGGSAVLVVLSDPKNQGARLIDLENGPMKGWQDPWAK